VLFIALISSCGLSHLSVTVFSIDTSHLHTLSSICQHWASGGQHRTPAQHLTQNRLVGALSSSLDIPSQNNQNLVDFYPSLSTFPSAFCLAFPFTIPQPTELSSLSTWLPIRKILPPRITKKVKTKALLARKVRPLWSTKRLVEEAIPRLLPLQLSASH